MRYKNHFNFIVSALLLIATMTILPFAATSTYAAETCTVTPVTLENGSMEEPNIGSSPTFTQVTSMPGWHTNSTDNKIEIWTHGYLGVLAAEGNQMTELSANSDAALYQDISSTPGSTLKVTFAHRGRNGVDAMNVVAGPPSANTTDYTVLARFSDDNTDWVYHTAEYVVPSGQTTTRLGFVAKNNSSGSQTEGNFLDDVKVDQTVCVTSSTPTPEPSPTPSTTPEKPIVPGVPATGGRSSYL